MNLTPFLRDPRSCPTGTCAWIARFAGQGGRDDSNADVLWPRLRGKEVRFICVLRKADPAV